ncbi:hypothetical protein Fcan01_19061 [Folsomia candida]|uniref:Uncharacterized protein n=1 Tax=Folsomia candida TaxID=158441 RepID=A0A226DPJ8_FOLCA|nr:hypothetical protein Fcan01_19061 [Folsomia candida]
MCDDSVRVPKQVEQKNFFRLVAGSWIITSVVITNCYTGLMISDLNSPLPTTNVPETFQDLICENKAVIQAFKHGENLTEWIRKANLELENVADPSTLVLISSPCFKILSAPSKTRGFEFIRFLYFTQLDIHSLQYLSEHLFLENIVTLLLGNRKHSFVPSGYSPDNRILPNSTDLAISKSRASIEKDVASCLKYVLAVDGFDVAAEFEFLSRKYYWIKFYRGKDSLGAKPFGWLFMGERESRVREYFQALLESGIHGRLDHEKQRRIIKLGSSILRYPAADNRMSLNSAFLTLFILCGTVIGFTMLCIIAELWVVWKMTVLKAFVRAKNCKAKCTRSIRIGLSKCVTE